MILKSVYLYNVPYNENSHHQPQHRELPESWTPVYEYTAPNSLNYYTSSETAFTDIRLNVPIEDIINCNYLLIIWSSNNNYKIYGWITNIYAVDEGTSHIHFNVDYWRTYIDKCNIIQGIVTNRRSSNNDPVQIVPGDYESSPEWEFQLANQLKDIAWVYLSYVSNGKGVVYITFPVSTTDSNRNIQINDPFSETGEKYTVPSFLQLINGAVATSLGLESGKILGTQISPLAPLRIVTEQSDAHNVTIDYDKTDKIEYNDPFTSDLIEYYPGRMEERFIVINQQDSSIVLSEMKANLNPNVRKREQLINFMNWYYFSNKTFKILDWLIEGWALNIVFEFKPRQVLYQPVLQALKYKTQNFEHLVKIEFHSDVYLAKFYTSPEFSWHFDQRQDPDGHFIGEFKQNEMELMEGLVDYAEKVEGEDEKWVVHMKNSILSYQTNLAGILARSDSQMKHLTLYYDNAGIDAKFLDVGTYKAIQNDDGFWPTISRTLKNVFKSTDRIDLGLMSYDGSLIKRFPKRRPITGYTINTITTGPSASLLIRFNSAHYSANNLEISLPLTNIEMTQSYLNEYMLSGQRDSDVLHRHEAISQAMSATVVNTGLTMALSGSVAAMGSAITSTSNTALNLFLGDNLYQKNKELILQNRGSALIRPANDYSWIRNGNKISIIQLKKDDYSIDTYDEMVKEYGIKVNEFSRYEKIQELINNTGPICIQDVIITGDLPVQAKDYIIRMLNRGVYIDPDLNKPIVESINTDNSIAG